MAVNAVLCLAVGGLAHFGTVCTSFCWVNSGTHQRSAMFWHGNEDLPYVREGSQLCSVTIALSMLTMCRGGMVTVENPVNSRLEMHEDFQFFIKWVKLRLTSNGRPCPLVTLVLPRRSQSGFTVRTTSAKPLQRQLRLLARLLRRPRLLARLLPRQPRGRQQDLRTDPRATSIPASVRFSISPEFRVQGLGSRV